MSLRTLIARARTRLREPSPIVVRELRALFRLPLFVRFFSLATGGIALVVLGIASTALSENAAPSEVGRILFDSFFVLVLLVTVVVTPLHAASAITSEREAQTYETLILSGMDPARIAVGKFLSTLAAIGLVVIALSPVVGLSFLFGGVSPVEVILGFLFVAALITPGAAYGVSVSARFEATRTSILLTLGTLFMLFPFASGLMMMVTYGYGYGRRSGFVDSLRYIGDNLGSLEVVSVSLLLPLALSALCTWFFLCTSVASLRPKAEDRVTPFKAWSLALALTTVTTLTGIALGAARDASDFAALLLGLFSLVVVSIFMDDSPLAPRTGKGTSSTGFARIGSTFGPGLLGTSNFAILLLVTVNVVGLAVLYTLVPHSTSGQLRDIKVAVYFAIGNVVVGTFLLLLGNLLRTVIENGNVVRTLVVMIGMFATIFPLVAGMAFTEDAHSREVMDTVMIMTPLGPFGAAVDFGNGIASPMTSAYFASLTLYGTLALVLWGALRRRVATLGTALATRRAELSALIDAHRAAREGTA
jgi:hypothetical protein